MNKQIILILVLIFSCFFRLFSITNLPPALNWDEVSHGYNAFSLLQAGKDEWGANSPVIFRAYGDYKLPVYIYLTAISEKIFGVSKPDYLKTNDIKNSIFKTNKENNPFFVYVHFPIPHYPYFFDSNGNKITDLNKNFNRTNKFYYLSQLKYTNSVIKEVTENIIKHDKNSIIIIQGDHGFRFLTNEKASDIDDEGFSILNAIYLPDSNYVGFPDTMNAINTFRYIFNNYFDTKLKILENKRTYILDSHEIINKTQIY